MKNLKRLGLSVMFGLALLTSCGDKPKETLENYIDTYQEQVEPGTGYQKYAIELKRKYPEKLDDLDNRDISRFLKQYLNDNQPLERDGKITLPKY